MSNLSTQGMRYAFLLFVISTHPSNSARAQGSPLVATESAASPAPMGASPLVGGMAKEIMSRYSWRTSGAAKGCEATRWRARIRS